MELKDARLNLVLSQAQIDRLDAWRAKARIRSRCDAIRRAIDEMIQKPAR